jgi:ATP-dependent Lhr-like helicase
MAETASMQWFHPVVADWFTTSFESPTAVQQAAWARINENRNVLVAAPTGSGKTLAAFLCAISALVEQSRRAPLADQVQVLYVSPLKALSNDIERNLQLPLAGIEQRLAQSNAGATGIRAMVRTGDTTAGEREAMRRRPPQILVTTPESLYLLLTAASGRDMLSGVRTVIVDEIHAVASNKRGSHLALSLARLDALCASPPVRIGLSATQKPIETMANFLTGGRECAIVDTGHRRAWDLQLEMLGSPLTAVLANEAWAEVYDRLEALVNAHDTTLIFVNTRRLAERLARHLSERLGEGEVTAHHGSLSREHRLEAEQALKQGRLKALVATASLELGIDIGHIDLVCQLGSPGSIAALLQRVGRSGHGVGETPRGRLFPLSRDDLVECVALVQAVEAGQLDSLCVPDAPLDVLAQQLVAELSAREWNEDALLEQVRQAWPYRGLSGESFSSVVRMLAEGYSSRRGRRSAFLFHDAINRRLRARPAARLTALQNGGAIPDHFDYEVVMLPQGHRVGSLNEDFAFESLPGDIFQLGNTSYRILKIEQGRVLVEDAAGQPPTIPFWFGDRPGRSDELSAAVSGLREWMESRLRTVAATTVMEELQAKGIHPAAAEQVTEYLNAALEALGALPTASHIVLERFFDDTGDMHLVVHAPLGSRLMRAWGLALRKRFCRAFNFELQASALEDSLILSLGETHSFELDTVPGYLSHQTVRDVLVQALLDAPMFEVQWRWNATIALAVQRMRNGQKLPPQWQRNQAEDLVAVVFPDQIACLENIQGAREIPDHPLVKQTISDCLNETMDISGLERLLQALEAGSIRVSCVDLTDASPLAREIINARPYAFLDDGEAENRRTRAIRNDPDDLSNAANLRIISVAATDQVRDEAWIQPRNPDELHDGLLQLGFLTQAEFSTGCGSSGAGGDATRWPEWFAALAEEFRVCSARDARGRVWWLATERLAEWLAIHPDGEVRPVAAREHLPTEAMIPEEALSNLLRDRLCGLGPVAIEDLADDFGLADGQLEHAMVCLQSQGLAIAMPREGRPPLWCERRLLARIHRYSREHRRRAVKPVPPAAFARFLFRWHGLDDPTENLDQALSQLEGWAAPALHWEQSILGVRCQGYAPQALDQRFLNGTLGWFRPCRSETQAQKVVAATPIAIVPRTSLVAWRGEGNGTGVAAGALAQKVLDALQRYGATFAADLERHTGLLRPQLEEALKVLVYEGKVTADAFSPLRWLLRPENHKARIEKRSNGSALPLGRWSLLDEPGADDAATTQPRMAAQQHLATVCAALLRRYGVVFRAMLQREPMLPPWRHLLGYLRRMEDRGEVRGGRFVDGFSGEQFALPEALGRLRQSREAAERPSLVVISAADPLNLGGWILPGPRTPAQMNNRVLLEDGLPVARLLGDELDELPGISHGAKAQARQLLTVVRPWRHRRR